MEEDKMDEKYGRKLRWNEPNWLTGDLRNYPTRTAKKERCKETQEDEPGPVQQSDLLKPLFMDIFQYGLHYAFKNYKSDVIASNTPGAKNHEEEMTSNPKHVIVVGAGLAGLVAAYELEQVGHRVTVLEQTTRAGGRVYTVGEKEGLDKGLKGEGKRRERMTCEKTNPNN